jgi:hypothetical protein
MVYVRRSLGGACSGALWTVEMSCSRRSLDVVRLLYFDTACQAMSAWTGLPK